jgi:hypothetical protein
MSLYVVLPTWDQEKPRGFKTEAEAFACAGWLAATHERAYAVRSPEGTLLVVGFLGKVTEFS